MNRFSTHDPHHGGNPPPAILWQTAARGDKGFWMKNTGKGDQTIE
jgi:hypothetical protein